MKSLSTHVILLLTAIVSVLLPPAVIAQATAPEQILFTNVSIFDGKSKKLITGREVLVESNLIKEIGRNVDAAEGATIIDGGGGTLMPGFSENHALSLIHI